MKKNKDTKEYAPPPNRRDLGEGNFQVTPSSDDGEESSVNQDVAYPIFDDEDEDCGWFDDLNEEEVNNADS